MTAQTLTRRATAVVGDYVTVPAVIERSVPQVAHLLTADHQRHPFWVRAQDVDSRARLFRGRVVAAWPEYLELRVYSKTDEYFLTVPADVVTVEPYVEELHAGFLYRPVDTSEPTWLYDGEAFYPVDTFPAGARDRDELPPRLESVGHLRDQ